ncbi:MAG: hypothetical protein ACKVS8_07155 [Phycisphaerales bacterium]
MSTLPPSSSPNPYRPFQPRPNPPAANPRKVRGGERPETRDGLPLAWAGQRLMRLLESVASGAAMTEGVAYAKAGQVRSLTTGPGHVSARVQGRVFAAYQVDLRLPVFTHEQWELALAAMAREARHLASLLSGEVPAGIEDVFAPLHLRLFPQDASEIAASCNCGRFDHNTPATPWCKHVACAIAVLADRVSRDPFRVFALRGLAKEDLLERLRQQRALLAARVAVGEGPVGAGGAGAPSGALMIGRPVAAYSPRVPGVGEQPAAPLAHCLDGFWNRPAGAPELELALEPPQVTHPMLRRLGPSPFAAGKFPLVGLLATCYEVIGQRALEGPQAPEGPVPEDPPAA